MIKEIHESFVDPDGPLIVKIPLEKIKLKKSVDEYRMTVFESGDSDDSYNS